MRSKKIVTQQTIAKCGKQMYRTAIPTKCGPKMRPSSKDFITQRTLTKCGPNIAPRRRTSSRSGLRPNVVQILPLIGGLHLVADFDQMWSKYCPSLEDFVTLRTFWPNVVDNMPLCWGLCRISERSYQTVIGQRTYRSKQIFCSIILSRKKGSSFAEKRL